MIDRAAGAVRVTDPDVLANFHSDEPGAHIYALADLEEPFWSASQWFRRGDAVVGVVSLPGGRGKAALRV